MGNATGRSCFKKAQDDSKSLVINSIVSHSSCWWDGSHVQKSWHFVRQQRAEQSTYNSSEEHMYESVSERSTNEEMATQTSICGLLVDYSLPELDQIYSEIRKNTADNRDDLDHYESVPASFRRPHGFVGRRREEQNPLDIDEFEQFYTEYNNYMSVVRLAQVSKDVSSIISELELDRTRLDQVIKDVYHLTQRLNALESTKNELIEVLHQHELLSFDHHCCSCQKNCE